VANTYSQSYFHLIFAVKNRKALIRKDWKNELEKYITGIVQNNKHKLIAIGAMPDHIHIFIGYYLNQKIPDLVEEIKTSSSSWIKYNEKSPFRFEWQKGYGSFTYAHSQLDVVAKYVLDQDEHHRKRTFREEYIEILNKFAVEYDDKYLFNFFDDLKGWE
jgi:REP element-mobilizing transposase RayT